MNTHDCPAGSCTVKVPNSQFACRTHWYQISKPTRDAIYATRNLPLTHDNRWTVVSDAIEELNATG